MFCMYLGDYLFSTTYIYLFFHIKITLGKVVRFTNMHVKGDLENIHVNL